MKRALWLAVLGSTACMRLDPFLFNPIVAASDDDLMASATLIPSDLRSVAVWDIRAADGGIVSAYILTHRSDDGTDVARHGTGILYCHGNAGNIANFANRVQGLWLLGYNVLVFDYRGYGKSPGSPTEPGIYADAQAARDYLNQRLDLGLNPNRIALYGYSLGGAVATELAVRSPTPALILESTFASLNELVDDNEDLNVPLAWYADASMQTRDKIARHHGALLVTHGEADTFIQVRYSHEIAAAANNARPVVTRWVPGATHSSVPCALHHRVGNGCGAEFDPEYLDSVSSLIDAAIP